MEMRSGRAAGRADPPDNLIRLDLLADGDLDHGEMAVAGDDPVAVIDLDHQAITAAPTSVRDHAGGGRSHRVAHVPAEIDACMHGGAPKEGIDANAKAGRLVDLAAH